MSIIFNISIESSELSRNIEMCQNKHWLINNGVSFKYKRIKYNQLGMKRADRGRDICKPRQLYLVITARKLVLYPVSLVVSPGSDYDRRDENIG